MTFARWLNADIHTFHCVRHSWLNAHVPHVPAAPVLFSSPWLNGLELRGALPRHVGHPAECNGDRLIASSLIRALKTAEIVAELWGAPVQIDIGLIERNFGSLDGLIIREVKQRQGPALDRPATSILPADADPWHEIFECVPPIMARWLNTFPDEILLFVAHGGVFDALHEHIIGPRAGLESEHAIPYAAWPSPDGWTLSLLE